MIALNTRGARTGLFARVNEATTLVGSGTPPSRRAKIGAVASPHQMTARIDCNPSTANVSATSVSVGVRRRRLACATATKAITLAKNATPVDSATVVGAHSVTY